MEPIPEPRLTRAHLTRLRQLWRSAGWPCRDAIEIDLLAGGWISALRDERSGSESLQLTEAGIRQLAARQQQTRRGSSRHDRLADRMARQLHESGRTVWRELPLRARTGPASVEAPVIANIPEQSSLIEVPEAADRLATEAGTHWRMARPDVFSIRNTSVEAYLHPVVHEIKVSRADLLSDLRQATKRESYQWLCCECYYVYPAGIAKPNEIPSALGLWELHGDVESGRLELVRPARHTPCTLPFAVWMALARNAPVAFEAETPPQAELSTTCHGTGLGASGQDG